MLNNGVYMTKKEIIKLLEEISIMLELKGENPFKSRAYQNAARAIETMSGDVFELVSNNEIDKVPGIGKAIADKLKTLITSGTLPYYDELKASIPEGLFEILQIPGLGPKKVKLIWEKLNITTIGELEYACTENRLRDLPNFGQKSQDNILLGIERRKKYNERFFYHQALSEAEDLLTYIKKNPQIIRAELAGSLRRKKETVKDIDIVASAHAPGQLQIMDHFINYPDKERVTGKGKTKSGIILNSGIPCDLRIVSDDQFPFALHHFTGSKEHNTAMRQRAKSKKLTMNEYGIFTENKEKSRSCQSEADIFSELGLHYIPPELRENYGEIEAAANGSLPDLVEEKDLIGLFHVHTTFSDGANTIKETALCCQEMGFKYLGISDHSKSAFYANGLTEDRIKEQHDEIDALNAGFDNFTILKGIESDILPNGKLDYNDSVLQSFDFIIGSVHGSFKMSEAEMTTRICTALENPYLTMLGHPTGRLLLGREAYQVNMPRILETAAKYNKIIEINANPHRLDLDWRWGKLANELGVKTAINPDAHSLSGLEDYRIGLGIARKGWFPADGVVNCLDAAAIKKLANKLKAN